MKRVWPLLFLFSSMILGQSQSVSKARGFTVSLPLNISPETARIFAGFSQTSAGARVTETDINAVDATFLQVFPNPTQDKATVSFVAPAGSRAVMEIYNMNGELVTGVLDATMPDDGLYSFDLDCSSFVKGIYFVRLTVGQETSLTKLVIIK